MLLKVYPTQTQAPLDQLKLALQIQTFFPGLVVIYDELTGQAAEQVVPIQTPVQTHD